MWKIYEPIWEKAQEISGKFFNIDVGDVTGVGDVTEVGDKVCANRESIVNNSTPLINVQRLSSTKRVLVTPSHRHRFFFILGG